MNLIKKYLLFTILFLFTALPVASQELLLGPSTGTMDSKSVFANPAVMSFQNSHVAMGLKGYHLGFFDESGIGYRQGYISYVLPRVFGSRFGSGVNIQYFDSPIFRRSQTGAGVSYRILNNLSAGAHISMYHLGYNRDNFTGFDFDDPVFSDGFSRFTFNSAAGIYFRPLPEIELAVGARNLNEPNLSLSSDNITEPRQLFGGVSYRHRMLKGTFELINGRYGVEPHLHAEFFSTQGFYVRSGVNLNFDNAYLEAQAHVGAGYSVNYQFDLPINEFAGNSSGSHMFSVVYEFNRMPSLPDRVSAPAHFPDLDRAAPQARFPGDVFLSSQTDHVIHYQKEIIRSIDENTILPEELSHLSQYDISSTGDDPRVQDLPYIDKGQPSDVPIPETVDMPTSISPQYREALSYIISQLEQDEFKNLKIKANPGSEMRAAGVRNHIRDESGEPLTVEQLSITSEADSVLLKTPADIASIRDEQIAIMDPEAAKIHTIQTHQVNIRNWELRISDTEDTIVHTISGASVIPEIIEWDWRLNNGEWVEPGVYNYQLYWTSADGSSYQSNRRSLYVQKILRRITIDITKDLNRILEDPDSIQMILKNN